jgi:opacity protein-like surface antigen
MYKYCLLFFFVFSKQSYSQDNRFKLLATLGMNASQINGDNLAGFDKIGLNAGLGVERDFRAKSALSFEINYSEKGSRDVPNAKNIVQDTLFRFNYIDIPILYTYKFGRGISAHAGIYTSILLKATYDDFVNVYDKSSILKKTDHGFMIGAGYSFNKHLSVQLRLSQSVYDVNTTFERYYNLVSNLSIRCKF